MLSPLIVPPPPQFQLNIGLFRELDEFNGHVDVDVAQAHDAKMTTSSTMATAGGTQSAHSAEMSGESRGADAVMSPEASSRAAATGCPFAKYAAAQSGSPDLKCQRFAAADRRALAANSAHVRATPLAVLLVLIAVAVAIVAAGAIPPLVALVRSSSTRPSRVEAVNAAGALQSLAINYYSYATLWAFI